MSERKPTGRPREITMEVAERFAKELASDICHSVESAGHAIGVNPRSIRSLIGRYERGECHTEVDEQIGEVLASARARHILELRKRGEHAGETKNVAGVKWFQWRLETQAPREHGRRTQLEVTGAEGGPLAVQSISREEALAELRKLAQEDPEVRKVLADVGGTEEEGGT